MFGTTEYRIWSMMKQRCFNPRVPEYRNYGGRGITCCKRWSGKHGFEKFYADMGPRPEGKTLDRRDNDGDYKPSNCRWATGSEQIVNRRPMGRRQDGTFTGKLLPNYGKTG